MKLWHYNKSLKIETNKTLGNTNTHHSIADLLVDNFVDFKLVSNKTRFLEPAVGAGSFYFAILDKLLAQGFDKNFIIENMIYAYDVDSASLSVLINKLKTNYQYDSNNHKIFNNDFLITKINERFDYIITNPPYISSKNIKPPKYTKEEYINLIKKNNNIEFDYRADVYMMFFLKTLNLMSVPGRQIFLCSDSWLDCAYGDVLKDKITSNFTLEYIINSQLFPFFRDDTNAIITVISNDSNKVDTNIISIKSNIDELAAFDESPSVKLSKNELKNIFTNKNILNKRNLLVLHGPDYVTNKLFIGKYLKSFVKVDSLIKITNTGVSQSTLDKEKYLLKNDGSGTPVFWQIQARINKKPNYKNYINSDELSYSINEEKLNNKLKQNIKSSSVYMSGIIDRFPLIFYTNNKTFHVSKYIHLDSSRLSPLEICLSLNNIFTFYNMELELKEGTRKTLRTGEMGLTKEIKIFDLANLYFIDFTKFNKETRKKIAEYGTSYQHKVIYNIEEALKDADYSSIQLLIKNEIGMSDADYIDIKEKLLNMYYFRMRNLAKLNLLKTKS